MLCRLFLHRMVRDPKALNMDSDRPDHTKLSPDKRALLESFLQNDQGLDSFPLSFAQQRLWFLDQLQPGNCAYNVHAAIRLRGRLNLPALERTFGAIRCRHESLRTTFANINGRLIQVLGPAVAFVLPQLDLRSYRENEREAEARRLAIAEAQRPFDLARGPLLRVTLLQLAEDEYVLLVTMHHIVSDGWSMGVLIREVVTLYEAFSNGRPSPLPELPIQYVDYACWQREWLQGERLERQLGYWREQLSNAPSILELPTDKPRPAEQTLNGARQTTALDPSLRMDFNALSREEGVTLFMILLAAFKALLYRYTGQEDISIGTPTANRNRAEIEGLIGFFVNTLVMRTDLSGDPTFRELLARVRNVALGAYAHQDLPFERLVDELKPERDLSRQPLFQVMFVLQNAPREDLRLPGLTLESLDVEETTARFDLSLLVTEREQRLFVLWDYNTDLFEAATIKRMARHFESLLENIVENPDQPLSRLELMTGQERHQVIIEWNQTKVDFPNDVCLHELFEQQAERTPQAVAVIFQDQQVSYAELNQRANQLAHYLQSKAVGPEVRVGVCVERGIEMIIAVLGVFKAGGAYVPLDAAYPEQRLSYMTEDAGLKVVVTQQSLGDRLAGFDREVVYVDSYREQIATQPRQDVQSGVGAGNLAYVIYTSGSTGHPKGVMVAHQAIVNTMLWRLTTFSLSPADCILQNIPLSFDPSIWQIFGALLSGARLELTRPGGHQDIGHLLKLMIDRRVSIADFPPSILGILLDEQHLSDCTALRCLFSGGEALTVDLQDRLMARLPVRLFNQYGPTESAIDTTFWPCEPEAGRRVVPIGRPIANMRVYLLDQHLQPVAVAMPGELYIGGIGLARGYLNSHGLTAERFIPDPFGDGPGTRLYRTGDLARHLPNGSIEFLGRVDHQVKIHGLRIELGEVEAALVQCPAVKAGVVTVTADPHGDTRLVAYIVSDAHAELTINELHSFLRHKIPSYMVPASFVMLDVLPLLPNGKVDRHALPAVEAHCLESQAAFVAPSTPIEIALAKLWVEILGVERAGVDDNFFYSGGHSLMAMQMVSHVRLQFGTDLRLRDFFMSPTIAGLAELVEEALIADASSENIDELLLMAEQAETNI
jgi:amino acid adenylation domain-containing protein